MSLEQIAIALWRDRLLFAVTLIVSVAAVIAITFSLPKRYEATATLYVGVGKQVDESLAFDTALGEQLARTYTSLAANPNVAEEVLRRSDERMTRFELQERMSFAPVERTQLLEITAQGGSPADTRDLANLYARTYVERVGQQYARGETQSRISVNEAAALPGGASQPNPPLYIGLGVLLSILLAAAAVVLRDRLDDRIRTAEEDDAVLGLPLAARIPQMSGRRGAKTLEVSDAFRLLKANVDFAEAGRSQVVMVTSPSPAEGKSTVAARLALAAAADGERVVLIDADLRRPALAPALEESLKHGPGLERSRTGLTNYLVGVSDMDDVLIRQPGRTGLTVIWSGPVPPNPSALLRSRRLEELVDRLRLSYDRIVVDTPPISVGADASLIVPRVDGTLLVLDAPTTKQSPAQAGLNQLEKAHARLLGVVLNRVAAPTGEDRGGYYGELDFTSPAAPPANLAESAAVR